MAAHIILLALGKYNYNKDMLVDSHCHLNSPDFKDDLDAVIARAKENGVGKMVSICTKLSEFEEIAAIASKYENVFCTVGVHPHDAEDYVSVKAEELVELTRHTKCVGIGETGLDFYYEHSPRDEQKQCLAEHIKAAKETGLPLVIHTREADEDIIKIIKAEAPFPGLLHCFSSGYEVAKCGIDNGLLVSLSGILTFKSAVDLQETAKKLPLEYLLVETDSPYLAPMPNRGKRNEPAFTKFTAQKLADLKNVSLSEIEEATTNNFHKLFTKVPR